MEWWFKCLFAVSSGTKPFLKTLDGIGMALVSRGRLLKSPSMVSKEVIRCVAIFPALLKEIGVISNKMKSYSKRVF